MPAPSEINGAPKFWASESAETNIMGKFLFDLYFRQIITHRNNFFINKMQMRQEFQRFLRDEAELGRELVSKKGTDNIGTLLHKTYFLSNTPRGCKDFKIKSSALFKYSNRMIREKDRMRMWSSRKSVNRAELDPALEALFKVDADSTSVPLIYRGTRFYTIDASLKLGTFACSICNIDFKDSSTLEKHVSFHNQISNFESLKDLKKLPEPIFKLSHQLCVKSKYFCFTIESQSDQTIVIEKMIVVQSNSMTKVPYVDFPFDLPTREKNAFHLSTAIFKVSVEQPIVIVFHYKEGPVRERAFEQHHFFCEEAWPVAADHARLTRTKFKRLAALDFFMPSDEISMAVKQHKTREYLMQSPVMTQFMTTGLTPWNICPVLTKLLEVEDMTIIYAYEHLKQRNVVLTRKDFTYSFEFDPALVCFGNLTAFDEVVVTPDETAATSTANDFNIEKKFYGSVKEVYETKVVFTLATKIPLHQKYSIYFRAGRLMTRFQYFALEALGGMREHDVKSLLFPERGIRYVHKIPVENLEFYHKGISTNPEQKQAVKNILNGPFKDAPYIIFGPPGTGKTTTIIEAIFQLYKHRTNSKILIMSGSNSACDEIALRLCRILSDFEDPLAILRVYSKSMEERSRNIDQLLLNSSNLFANHFYPAVGTLHQYKIIVTTLGVVGNLSTANFGIESGKHIYTHIFIDEVAASTEIESLMGIIGTHSKTASIILSGDHKQLGPILRSPVARDLGLGVSLMERLMRTDCYHVDQFGNYDWDVQARLVRNYRSHPEIVRVVNQLYYNGTLRSLALPDVNLLCKQWYRAPNPNFPIIFHSVLGELSKDPTSHSLCNGQEVEIVMDYVKDLIYCGVHGIKIAETDIGIISPYKKQYQLIQKELNIRKWTNIETGSVEIFQGREKRIIIISFVRSFQDSIGFLDNPKRLNVAISRPKSLLILIGNPQTLSMNPDFKFIIDQCQYYNTLIGDPFDKNVQPISNGIAYFKNGRSTPARQLRTDETGSEQGDENQNGSKNQNENSFVDLNRLTQELRISKPSSPSGTQNKNTKDRNNTNKNSVQHQNKNGSSTFVKSNKTPSSNDHPLVNHSSDGGRSDEIEEWLDRLPKVPDQAAINVAYSVDVTSFNYPARRNVSTEMQNPFVPPQRTSVPIFEHRPLLQSSAPTLQFNTRIVSTFDHDRPEHRAAPPGNEHSKKKKSTCVIS